MSVRFAEERRDRRRIMRIAVRSAVVSALLGAPLCGYAQTPPAQPSYPASPRLEHARDNQNRVTSQRAAGLQTQTPEAEPRCDTLSGLEKSECERRDVSNDAAPAGVTPSMQEQEQRRREDSEAAAASEAEADSDTAARKPANPDDEVDDEDEAALKDAANRREQPTESDSDADTLNSPRR